MALNLQQSCSNIVSVTHMIDNYKLNIRRLFKEYLTPGVPEDTFICLDQLLPSSTPDYFTLSKFIWYSNWPSRYHSLPERCASPTFTISSKVTLYASFESLCADFNIIMVFIMAFSFLV